MKKIDMAKVQHHNKKLSLTCNPGVFEFVALKTRKKVCENSQPVAAFKVTLVQQDGDKMPTTLNVTVISLQLNGVKFAITSQLFVIIWILTVINWQDGKPVASYI